MKANLWVLVPIRAWFPVCIMHCSLYNVMHSEEAPLVIITVTTVSHYLYTPRTTKLLGGYIGFTRSVRLSVRPSVPRPSHIRPATVSALYLLQFWLDPFHIYTSYKATSEGVSRGKFLAKCQNLKFWQFFKICNFDFVLFWLGIWCESLVWVIIGRRGYLRTQAF